MAEHAIEAKDSSDSPGYADVTIRTRIPLCELRAAEIKAQDYEEEDVDAALVIWAIGLRALYSLPVDRPVSGCRCSRCASALAKGVAR